MKQNNKITRFFSGTLMKQTIKSNFSIILIVTLIMCMMSGVTLYASSMMNTGNDNDYTDVQKDFYSYLYVMASYNEVANTHLSYKDFEQTNDISTYETAFAMANKQSNVELSTKKLRKDIAQLKSSDIPIQTYVRQFEYVYALNNQKGCFSNKELNIQDMVSTILESMGVSSQMVDMMSNMDSSSMINTMYFTVMGIIPIFLLIVIVVNSLVADQVDKGSLAYILSTPIERKAINITHIIYLLIMPLICISIVCCTRIFASYAFMSETHVDQILLLYLGMYLLVEAVAGICYFGSCFFNRSKNSMAFGGGLAAWFFLASLLGMFGTQSLVDMGIGASSLSIFNKLTLVSLFDIDSITSISTSSVNYDFVWKYIVLLMIAIVFYFIGSKIFEKKDLPL